MLHKGSLHVCMWIHVETNALLLQYKHFLKINILTLFYYSSPGILLTKLCWHGEKSANDFPMNVKAPEA